MTEAYPPYLLFVSLDTGQYWPQSFLVSCLNVTYRLIRQALVRGFELVNTNNFAKGGNCRFAGTT